MEEPAAPPGMTQAHLDFLDRLCQSRRTNMVAAVPYLRVKFPSLDREQAEAILKHWLSEQQ